MQIVDQYSLVRPRHSRGTVFANRFHRRAYNRLQRIGLNAREADEEFTLLPSFCVSTCHVSHKKLDLKNVERLR
jgi:hypothetical protein